MTSMSHFNCKHFHPNTSSCIEGYLTMLSNNPQQKGELVKFQVRSMTVGL